MKTSVSLYQVYIKSCLTLLILGPQKTSSQLTQLTAKLKNAVKRKGDGDARSEKCRKWVRNEQKKLAVKKPILIMAHFRQDFFQRSGFWAAHVGKN